MSYASMFKVIAVPGQRMHRDPDTKKKLVDGKPAVISSWEHSLTDAPIMLVDTGSSSIVGVDFDDEQMFNTALQLDPDCRYIARGVGKGGGHFIYNASNISYLQQHITNPNGCNIPGMDLQMGRKLLYLATPANETKALLTNTLKSYDDLTSMPLAMQLYVVHLYQTHQIANTVLSAAPQAQEAHSDSKLHFIVKEAIDSPDQYHHKFFNIVTTKRYKGIMAAEPKHPQYPWIPDNLPMGESGNQYMVSIATILGRDPSVDSDLFLKAMLYTNSLFSSPMPESQIIEIVNYITSGQSKINGVSVWQYNPDWNKAGMIYTDNYGNSHEIFSFNNKGSIGYLDHNHITNQTEIFTSAGAVIDAIKMVSSRNNGMSKERLMTRTQKVNIISSPLLPFGAKRSENGITFNDYLRTEEQNILMDPSSYTGYKRPSVTLKFLENSMGYDKLYKFFLPFIKRKLTTREFSPLILVFYGPPHSGKSAITNGVLRPLTKGRSISLSPEVATEKHNDWKVNQDFILLDELHNARQDHRQALLQVMNSTTGSNILTGIRKMNQSASAEEYSNEATFVITCNKPVKLSSEAQDRRLVINRSYKSASEALEMENDDIFKAIVEESKDFAYYLATEVEVLSHTLYLRNDWLKDNNYNEFQEDALDTVSAIATAISNQNFKSFMEILEDRLNINENDVITSAFRQHGYLHIRIHNTYEHEASFPSVVHASHLEINGNKGLMTELKRLEDRIVFKKKDSYQGKIYGTNRKTDAKFAIHTIPEDFLAKISQVVAMEPLDNEEELLLS